MSAVSPRELSRALAFAPRASSIVTISAFPVRAAVIRMASVGCAPAFKSAWVIGALAFSAASDSGVTP